MTNPLNQFFRIPKLYTKLPSQGRYYPTSFLETSVNSEVAVYALTVMDQLMLKTPDAVLNGETLLKIVKNCVPGVQDPAQLVEPDINTLLLAIRIASNGSNMLWDTVCPKCNAEHRFDVNLTNILESQTYIQNSTNIDFNGELVIHIRPYNFKQRHMQLLNDIEQSQALRILDSNQEISEAQKSQELSKHMSNMTDRTFDLLAMSITHITVVTTQVIVSDYEYIREFVKGITKKNADAIIEKIREINQTGINTTNKFRCDSCTHEWDQELDFDPLSFFD